MPTRSGNFVLPLPLVVFLGWLIPGSGYWLLGQRGRALTVGITVVLLFALGCLIGGVRVVDMPDFFAAGGANPLARLLQKPWFIGQALAGLPGLIAAWAAGHVPGEYTSHARIAEIGTLYTAVAGMLNLLAVLDASYRASQREGA